MRLYEYAVLLDERTDRDDVLIENSEIVVPVTAVLARDDAQAQLLAARSIPDEYVTSGRIDRLTVVVRPF